MLLRITLCWLCSFPLLGVAQTADEAAAREEFEAGRVAYDHGSFTDALAHFERAYALQPKPELLYNVGRAADSDGQPTRATEAYEAYLASEPDAHNADFVRARLLKMQAMARERELKLPTVAEAEPAAPPAPLRRDEPHRTRRALLWASVGVLVAGGIVAGVLLATRERSPERVEADAYAFIPGGR
ncbi:MAG TPA: tetratricopeptide repeat protein [Polyangiales bacterium]|nr:tetratricopeptide repeat protein [Polyangiales bacterium]